MRIALVQAFTALDMELVYPIGLAYLAAHLDGHEVELFDLNLHRDEPFGPLEEWLRRFKPEVVGISLRNMKVGMPHLYTDDFAPQQASIERIKAICPDVVIVAGGTAFSLYAEVMMRRVPAIDLGLWGEGEHRFAELLEDLSEPQRVKGLYIRGADGEVTYTGPPTVQRFGELRPPRRDLLDHAAYKVSSPVSIGVQAKRGCALRCIHCSDTWLSGHQVRQRDPTEVADEVELLVREHGVEEFFFCDQIFNIPVQHAIDICKALVERKLDVRWSAWFNEHRNTLPDELMTWLKRAGCSRLSFSPDHVDDRVLRRLDKNFRRSDMYYTIEVAKKHSMDVEYSFFLNAPGEDWRSLFSLVRFLGRARLELGSHFRPFTLVMLQPIRIYPHTRLEELARQEGIVPEGHDLVEGVVWNPGLLRAAVWGIQSGARFAYGARQRMRG